ncbi:MAG: ion channel [Leptolyngbyaceae cyanobacterium bins.349]|nr:ion channel [Leptolyngbyaceae cyanobacterium bins.349]
MHSDDISKLAENKYNRLLVILFLLLVSIGLPERRDFTKVGMLIVVLISMLSIIRKIRPGKSWVRFYTGLISINLILLGLQILGMLQFSALQYVQGALESILFITIGVPLFLIQKEVFSTQRVTTDVLKGGIAIYVLLGLAWAIFYTILYLFDVSAFYGVKPSQFQADFLHFSFITLTTVGYGDIHPLATSARIATTLEAIVGVMYPAVLISRLVSLYSTHSQES